MAETRIVMTTVDEERRAEQFAAALIERRLAACVNVGPVRSVYRWKGRIEREVEYLLIIKTTAEQASRLEAFFKELHPYELPERIEVSLEGGSEEYLAWVSAEVQGLE